MSKLVAAFPNGGQAAGKAYIGALAAVLLDYPRAIAARCVDPKLGVARETRFLPTVADLVAWCERETASMRRPVEHEDREARILREMAERREAAEKLAAARATRPTYEEMKERYGLGSIAEEVARAKMLNLAHVREGNRLALDREFAAHGERPTGAISVSPSLRKLLQPAPAGEAG